MKCAHLKLFTTTLMLVCSLSAFCQVTTIDEIKLPPPMREKYPFLKETFYAIKALDSTGMEGYFVFTLDKSQLNAFMDNLIHNQVVNKLQQLNFFRKVCKPSPILYACSRKYSDLTQFSLQQTAKTNNVFSNRTIEKRIGYSLDARYIKYSHAFKFPYGCKKSKNQYDRRLFNATINTASFFQYDPSTLSLQVLSSATANVNILFDECMNHMLSITPYNSVRTEVAKLNQQVTDIKMDELSEEAKELLALYMENVKRIRLTEDQNNYYVYCIKSKI